MASADTIVAIATPPGRGGIGVIRISGKDLQEKFSVIYGGAVVPRHASLRNFVDSQGAVLDRGIVIYFPAPGSYTGEDVIELHGHGGPVVTRALLNQCLCLGARVAEPGEFTKRAFLNEKMDLAQAEAVADLISAQTLRAARCAQRSLQGEFSREIENLVQGLTNLRVMVEGNIDFPEEADLECTQKIELGLSALIVKLDQILTSATRGHLLREGALVVLAGEPNAGKSTLLNLLCREEVAIVTPVPGTTRDPLRHQIEIEGIPICLVDTAGLRDPADEIEKEGIRRARVEIDRADVIIEVIDATQPNPALFPPSSIDAPTITVLNKIDLSREPPRATMNNREASVWLSAKTGAGIDLLKEALLQILGRNGSEEVVYVARERHVSALALAQDKLMDATIHFQQLELLAEDLRLSQNALATITGTFVADDLLGEIFSSFCIGK